MTTPTQEVVAETHALTALLRQIPTEVRRYEVTTAAAQQRYGLCPQVLSEAVDAGLPHLAADNDALFDAFDLTNLALCLPLHTPLRSAMNFWNRVLQRPESEDRHYDVEFYPVCPAPGHRGDCEFTLPTPDQGVITVNRLPAGERAVHTSRVLLRGDWPDLPAEAVELADGLSHIEFVRLPHAIRWDTAFIRRTGIGDCPGIARLIAEEGRRRGLVTRVVFGLIVAPPYSMPHFWPEIKVSGRWVPCDPGLITGLVRWGVIRPRSWPTHRSTGGFLVGLSPVFGRPAQHRGLTASVSYRTTRAA